MIEPKWPGCSATVVIGLGIGAVVNNDALGAVLCFACAAVDCFRCVKR